MFRIIVSAFFRAFARAIFPKDDPHQADEGRLGGVLWAASAADGKRLVESRLEAAPAWDGLAAASGKRQAFPLAEEWRRHLPGACSTVGWGRAPRRGALPQPTNGEQGDGPAEV